MLSDRQQLADIFLMQQLGHTPTHTKEKTERSLHLQTQMSPIYSKTPIVSRYFEEKSIDTLDFGSEWFGEISYMPQHIRS